MLIYDVLQEDNQSANEGVVHVTETGQSHTQINPHANTGNEEHTHSEQTRRHLTSVDTVPGVSLPEYQYPGEDVEERMRDTEEEVDL